MTDAHHDDGLATCVWFAFACGHAHWKGQEQPPAKARYVAPPHAQSVESSTRCRTSTFKLQVPFIQVRGTRGIGRLQLASVNRYSCRTGTSSLGGWSYRLLIHDMSMQCSTYGTHSGAGWMTEPGGRRINDGWVHRWRRSGSKLGSWNSWG